MIEYFAKLLQKAYEFINPIYAQNRRLAEFEELKNSGRLEGMCGSEVEAMFGIRGISSEI